MINGKISDVCSNVYSGGTPNKKHDEYYVGGNIPWLNTSEIKFNRITATEKFITDEGYSASSAKWVPANAVIVAMYGATAARVAISKIPLTTNQACCNLIIDDSKADYRYVYYWLCSRYTELASLANGGAQQNLNAGQIKDFPIAFPHIDAQKKIADLLSAFDDKIEVNNEINENLLQQASTIFKHWFTDNPSLDTLEQVPLADLCLVVTKGTTPTTLGKPFVSEGINFIKAESILDNHAIDKNKFAFIDSETNDLLRRSIISSGDIVFTIAGTLGRFALIDDSVLPANTNQAVAIIRANKSKVTPEYLYSFFLGNWHNDYYTKRIQQAVQANLSLGTIKSLPIPILSDKAMPEYLGIISPIITMTKANELEITRLRTMRDALLPQLMSGQLDVSDLDL